MNQLLLDLRNAVWALEAQNRLLNRSVHGARTQVLEGMVVQEATSAQVQQRGGENMMIHSQDSEMLRKAVADLEAQRKFMVGCALSLVMLFAFGLVIPR